MRVFLLRLVFLFSVLFGNKASAIEVYVQPLCFYTSSFQAYLETRLFIHEKGIQKTYLKDSTAFIQVLVTFYLRKDGELLKAEKLSLQSPAAKQVRPIIHAVRWAVSPGDYVLETKITDPSDPLSEIGLIDTVRVHSSNKASFLSDIQLSGFASTSTDSLSAMVRNGIYSEPIPFSFFDQSLFRLYAYMEVYRKTDKSEKQVLKFDLMRKDSSGRFALVQEWFKKLKSITLEPYLLQHDISELTTGSYQLIVSLQNDAGAELDSKSVYFERRNPFWDRIHYLYSSRKEDKLFFDTLSPATVEYALRAVHPLIESQDVPVIDRLIKDNRDREKRLFLFNYFSNQSDTARSAFGKYMKLAHYLDVLFKSGFGYGFETDRGIIYLRYGRPDEVISEDKDNGAFPYEIWKYHRVRQNNQTNVKFLFYNPDLAESDFRLLHSTAIGERFNRRWEVELYKNAKGEFKGDNELDATEMKEGFNRRAREYFDR